MNRNRTSRKHVPEQAWVVVAHLNRCCDRYWLGDDVSEGVRSCGEGGRPPWCEHPQHAHRFDDRAQAERFARSCDTNHLVTGYEAAHIRVG